ncbi:TPA: hypothetical protein N0F65_005027 [Lagenidium giganteum]|uniref:Uncharacterized protein n=1 Tax=Lagenidium giganteum TaxID=4803 RepID=A0AAV2ZKF6_9STRA|nr:TPA: hypothetical protein N0F65_005027 [Lagenidium giganteum]
MTKGRIYGLRHPRTLVELWCERRFHHGQESPSERHRRMSASSDWKSITLRQRKRQVDARALRCGLHHSRKLPLSA